MATHATALVARVLNLTVKNLHVSGGLSRVKVRQLIAAGWELASHTLTPS